MTTQNMKLLDLETGKYLELGKDWVYGGKDIYVIPTHYLQITKTDHIIKLYYNDKVEIIDCELPDEYKARVYATGQFSKYTINGKEYDMGYFTELGSLRPINDAKKCEKSEQPLELKEICEKTGAVVYGGRYVLLQTFDGKAVGDIIKHNPKLAQYDKLPVLYNINKEVSELITRGWLFCQEMGFSSVHCDPNYHFDIVGNAFEEYSKQLRNEPNQFEEIEQLTNFKEFR